MKKTNWLTVSIIAVVAILILFWIGTMIGGWGSRGYSMMDGYSGMMGRGMMGNWGYSPLGWFGMGLGMISMWLIPIGVIALIVFGIVALVRNTGNPPQAPSQTSCPNCGKGTQADWKNCPYCGATLK